MRKMQEEIRISVTYIDGTDDFIKVPTLIEALSWVIRNTYRIQNVILVHYYKDEDSRYWSTDRRQWYFDREDLIGSDARWQEIIEKK